MMALSSCKKNNNDTQGTSVNLRSQTFFKNNQDEIRIDRTGTIDKTSWFSIKNTNEGAKLFVNLGAEGLSNTIAVFGLAFTFTRINSPANLTSSYTFPSANSEIKVMLRNQLDFGQDEIVMSPVYGRVYFTYDSISRKLNGKVEGLEFNLLGQYPFDRIKVIINGTFNNISLR